MKLASLKDGRAIVTDGTRFTPLASLGFSGSMLEFVQAGESALEQLRTNLAGVGFHENLQMHDLARPIGKPTKVICIGLNYRDHAIEAGMAIPSVPVVFKPSAIPNAELRYCGRTKPSKVTVNENINSAIIILCRR